MAKCGHCKSEGVSVAHVRECASHQQQHPVPAPRSVEPELPSLGVAPEEGVYMAWGVYFKVQESQNGRFYAKQWNEETGEWVYVGRQPLYGLTAKHRVTAEEAARFGQVTGQCVFCGRRLTDERSITVGYGPTCAEKYSLPWGAPSEAEMLKYEAEQEELNAAFQC